MMAGHIRIGRGSQKQTYHFTLAVATTKKQLPAFTLSKEGFFDRIFDKFTHKDINFPEHPEFSKKYYITGDESARKFFTEKVIRQLEQKDIPPLESNGGYMLFKKHDKMRAEHIQAFMQNCQEVLDILENY